jgi:chemotaxis protein MotB
MAAKSQPIIVIKKYGGHAGHHGGAWKVAYADFVTAMMSLFIVLWLMGSSEKVKKAVAGYFNDPKGTATLLGTTMSGTGDGAAVTSDKNLQQLQQLKQKLEQEIKDRKDLENLIKQIEITITSEGLRIELLEDKNGTFYQSGSANLSPSGQEILALLAAELKTLPNQLLIEGHTDAAQYSTDADYSNWELSADRANAARRLLQAHGVRSDQVTQVRGYADQFLRVKSNPYDPSNRRISILVKNQDGASLPAQLAHAQVVGSALAAANSPTAAKSPVAPAGAKPETAPSSQPAAPKPPVGQPALKPPANQPTSKPSLFGKLTSMLPGAKK